MTLMHPYAERALDLWQHNQDMTILHSGSTYSPCVYVLGYLPEVLEGREDWYQTSPEELEAFIAQGELIS